MNKILVIVILLLFTSPAAAQLAGTDTAPGDSCVGFPAGASRVSADADGDGGAISLICDGSIWQVEANDIQDGLRRIAVESDPCSDIGKLASSASGDLLVCRDASPLAGQNCTAFSSGALSLDVDGALHVCLNP